MSDVLRAARQWMLYDAAASGPSRDREWWGTVVVSGSGTPLNVGVDVENGVGLGMLVTAGWKGWLRVEREDLGIGSGGGGGGGFASVEEALAQREAKRKESVERGTRWVAGSGRGGAYAWKE